MITDEMVEKALRALKGDRVLDAKANVKGVRLNGPDMGLITHENMRLALEALDSQPPVAWAIVNSEGKIIGNELGTEYDKVSEGWLDQKAIEQGYRCVPLFYANS